MREVLNIQKQLIPDLIDLLRKRYTILNHILLMGTAGRRTLAASLDMSERVLRAETDFLKEQGLLRIDSNGMTISLAGEDLLASMEPMVKDLFGLSDMEAQLCKRFGLSSVTVVPGDSDISPIAKKELGRAGAHALRKVVTTDDIVAVAGGSTMAEVANGLKATTQLKGICFVPARGGLGESVEFQASTIASAMAKKIGGQYRLLHVPDFLSEDAYLSLIDEPNVKEIVTVIRQARIVIHGIGDAVRMAERRKLPRATIDNLKKDGGLAEAFGYYFNRDGHVVHKMHTVGLRLEDIQQTDTVIAVAGGRSKGEAIRAIMKFGHEDILVTDEAAAKVILAEE
ncbi:MAG: sugar-binding domain-containing protein [Paenibacillaceae bacterium]